MSLSSEVEELAKKFSERHRLDFKREGATLVLHHRRAPLYIYVKPTSQGVEIGLGYHGLKDYIREIVDSEENPRDYIEELLDDMSSLAHRLMQEIKKKGYKALLKTRETVIDFLEELEEALEE